MKKFVNLFVMMFAFIATVSLVSCDTKDEPNGDGSIDTSKDPQGTVLINMIADDYYHGNPTKIPGCCAYMDEDLNWHGADYRQYYDCGDVKNISAIKSVPKDSWTETCAVIPGHGYIIKYYRWENVYDNITGKYICHKEWHSYYRVYVVSWIEGVSGGILGAVVKYQPDWQEDEPIETYY